MSISTLLLTILFCLVPIFELRGAIPWAVLAREMPLIQAYIICVLTNALVAPLVFIFLSTAHKLLIRWNFYKKIFDKFVEKTRKKVHNKIEKYGYMGITIFVAIPLPITGAYTGALGAWLLGMNKTKTFLACALGVLISGTIVSAIVYFLPMLSGPLKGFFQFFLKDIH